jgi:hypothetical protein
MLLQPDLIGPALVLPAGAEFGGPLVRPVLDPGGLPRPAVVLATLRASSAGAANLGVPTSLIGVGALGADVAVTRAQTPSGAGSTALNADGLTSSEYGADLPRFVGSAQRLLIEPQSTDSLTNPRCEGGTVGVVGAGGVLPTGMAFTTAAGLSVEVVALAPVNGVDAVTLRFFGTASATGMVFSFCGTTAVAAVNGQSWVGQFFSRIDAATLPPTQHLRRMVGRNGAGSALQNIQSVMSPTLDFVRQATGGTLANASTAFVNLTYVAALTVAASYDWTMTFGWPNLQQIAVTTTPILPAVGAPAASTRGADVPIWTPAAMPARGAILLRGTVPALAGASPLGLLELDDGTDTNRIVARIVAGGGQPELLAITSGVTVATLTPTGSFVAGSEWRALVAWSPGGVRFGTSAGGVVSASVARPPGLVRGVLGHANAAGTQPLGGEITADLYDYWPSEAEALALLT